LSSKLHPDISTFASFLFALPFYAVLITLAALSGVESFSFSTSFMLLVLARSVTDVFAEGFKMKAFATGDISLVSSFLSLSPLILAMLSPFVTGDRVTQSDILALACIVVGSVLLIKRDSATGKVLQIKSIVYALLAAVAFALNSCFDRLAVVNSGALISGFAMTLLAALFCIPLALRHRRSIDTLVEHRRGFIARGAWETIFMVSKLSAMSILEAHVVLGVSRISLILSVIAGWIWFGERNILRRGFAALFIYLGLVILFVSRY
jgi:drug/metabolite transporter (DMT)-like permease